METTFAHKGSTLIKSSMSKIRNGHDSGRWLLPTTLEALRNFWATDAEFLRRSAIAKQNRASETGAPLYTGGSSSAAKHAYNMELVNLRKPKALEILSRTKKRKDGHWVDDFSQSVADRVEQRRREIEENADGNVVDEASENAIYIEVVGGRNKRGNVYGLGGLGDQYLRETGVPFQSQVPPPQVPPPPHYAEKITRLEEELGEKNKEIGDIRATLQAVLDHLGMTMPEAHSMRTNESSVHLADDFVDGDGDGDGDGAGGIVGSDVDGDDHVLPTL